MRNAGRINPRAVAPSTRRPSGSVAESCHACAWYRTSLEERFASLSLPSSRARTSGLFDKAVVDRAACGLGCDLGLFDKKATDWRAVGSEHLSGPSFAVVVGGSGPGYGATFTRHAHATLYTAVMSFEMLPVETEPRDR